MKRLLVILSLAALAGATSGAGVRSATSALERSASNTEGAVVFASSRDGDFDLYAVNTDGTGSRSSPTTRSTRKSHCPRRTAGTSSSTAAMA